MSTMYFDDEFDHDFIHQLDKGMNEIETDNNSVCSHDNDSEEEIPDDLDDDGYGGYNEQDRGYYNHDGRYERKTPNDESYYFSSNRLLRQENYQAKSHIRID